MPELQEIEVTIDADGSVRLAVSGVKGARCEDLTRALEALLGGEVIERRHTAEYHEQPLEEEQHLREQT